MWEETEVLGENPRVRVGDRHTLSHTTSADHGDRTRVAVVRSESATSTLPGHPLRYPDTFLAILAACIYLSTFGAC